MADSSNSRSSYSKALSERPGPKRINLDAEIARSTRTGKAGGAAEANAAGRKIAGGGGASGGVAGKAPEAGVVTGVEEIPAGDPWAVSAAAFPSRGLEAQLRFAVRYAVLAPSSHNSQPWHFRVEPEGIDVLADRARALPVVDPGDRELTISVGCAVHHLRVALRALGLGERTLILPDRSQPDLMARIEPARHDAEPGRASEHDVSMFKAIPRRRTCRHAFESRSVPGTMVTALVRAAERAIGGAEERAGARSRGSADEPARGSAGERAELVVVDDALNRGKLAALIAEADQIQFADRSFRRELAAWMHHSRTSSRDGLPGYALGMGELASLVAPLIVRTFDVGKGKAARDRDIAVHSPVLAVVRTDRDDERGWLAAGQALSAVLLTAAAHGLTASYLNQPVEVPALRAKLDKVAPGLMAAQLVLRLGFGPHTQRTPRRGLDQVEVR